MTCEEFLELKDEWLHDCLSEAYWERNIKSDWLFERMVEMAKEDEIELLDVDTFDYDTYFYEVYNAMEHGLS